MARVFKNHVHVLNPNSGLSELFEPGDQEPDWAVDLDFEIDENNFMTSNDVINEDGSVSNRPQSYHGLNKDELLDLLNERGLDASPGSKAEFIARLQADDRARS